MSKYKFAPALALKWYPQVLIGQAKLFDYLIYLELIRIRAANAFAFGPQEGACYRGKFVIWPRVLIIIGVFRNGSVNYFSPFFLHNLGKSRTWSHVRLRLKNTKQFLCVIVITHSVTLISLANGNSRDQF